MSNTDINKCPAHIFQGTLSTEFLFLFIFLLYLLDNVSDGNDVFRHSENVGNLSNLRTLNSDKMKLVFSLNLLRAKIILSVVS